MTPPPPAAAVPEATGASEDSSPPEAAASAEQPATPSAEASTEQKTDSTEAKQQTTPDQPATDSTALAVIEPAQPPAPLPPPVLTPEMRAAMGEAYAIAIRGLARVGDAKTALERLADIQRCQFTLSIDTVNAVLEVCARRKLYEPLESTFWSLYRRGTRLVPTTGETTTATDTNGIGSFVVPDPATAKTGRERRERFKQYLAEPAGDGPNLQSFKIVMNAYAELHDTANVYKYLRVLKANRWQPDLSIYNTLIKAHIGKGEVEQIIQRIHLMRTESGLTPDTVTYNSLLSACAKRESDAHITVPKYFEEMKILYRRQRDAVAAAAAATAAAAAPPPAAPAPAPASPESPDSNPDAKTKTKAKGAKQQPKVTSALPRFVPPPTITVRPDAMTYAVVINTLLRWKAPPPPQTRGSAERLTRAEATAKHTADVMKQVSVLFKEMQSEFGISPDAHIYNSLCAFFARAGDLESMQRYFFLMRDAGIIPSVVNYQTVIGGLATEHDLFSILEHVREMKQLEIKPSLYIYSTLMSEYARRLDVVSLLRIWDELQTDINARTQTHGSGAVLTPNRHTWHAILPHFLNATVGVSERIALAARRAWDTEPEAKARAGQRSPRDRELNPRQLTALIEFMETLRLQKWTL